ncbi:DUF378 domain-containing protein [Patescibacteria group bacterium]|nr:DUF378 domain-containing protein [Patescibacteria group bacterium]
MKAVHMIAFILLAVGGLNWGLVGLGGFAGSDWNLVHMLVGSWPMVEWAVYVLVGASAIYVAVGHKKVCSTCSM